MLNPRPSVKCGMCVNDEYCNCACHTDDLVNGYHFEVHIDDIKYKVKPVVDLDNYR